MADTEQPIACPECGAANKTGARQCHQCGEALGQTAVTGSRPKPRPASDDDPDAERPRKRRPRDDDEDEDDDRPRRRRPQADADELGATPLAAVVPVGVSPWALAACYLGLIGCIPLLGAPFALFGVLFGIIALVRRPKNVNYGSITGHVRAFIGIACGLIGLILSVVVAIGMFAGRR